MVLSEWQVDEVARYVVSCCDTRNSVQVDLTDHICCMVEERMDEGVPFDEAMRQSAEILSGASIREIESDTLKLLDMKKKNTFGSAFRWWFALIPLIIMVAAVFITGRTTKRYFTATATLSVTPEIGLNKANVADVILSRKVLEEVALNLYIVNMQSGDPERDNRNITAQHFRELQSITPAEVKALVDRDVEKPLEKLKAYRKPEPDNFVHGLTSWHHPHYSYESLHSKIKVINDPQSDQIFLEYTNDDPGIVCNTLEILMDETQRHYLPMMRKVTNDDGHTHYILPVAIFDHPSFPVASEPTSRRAAVVEWLTAGIALTLLLWYLY